MLLVTVLITTHRADSSDGEEKDPLPDNFLISDFLQDYKPQVACAQVYKVFFSYSAPDMSNHCNFKVDTHFPPRS